MKKLVLFIILLFPLFARAQEFHFVYLRVDGNMEISLVKQQIMAMRALFQQRDFVLYYSNSSKSMDVDNYNEKELFGLIGELSSSFEITIPNEIDSISGLLEKFLHASFNGSKQLVSSKYTQLIFDFIVGKDFIDKKYHDEILARSILINSLTDFNTKINFYPIDADYSSLDFDPLYHIKHKINIKKL